MRSLLSFFVLASLIFPSSQQLMLSGTVTNMTGEISAPARLELFMIGQGVTAQLVTSLPLTGTGELTGLNLDGWFELSGKVEGGLTLKFRGVLNSKDFRGTYTVTPEKGAVQYGHFVFVVEKSTPAAKSLPRRP